MITKQIFNFEKDGKTYYYAAYNEYHNIVEKNNKFYAKIKCSRCGGEGRIGAFMNIREGICFACYGAGYELARLYTAANKKTIENRLKKEDDKAQASQLSYNDAVLNRMLKMFGENFYLVLDTKDKTTYKYKNELKQQGCLWNSWFEAWYNKDKEIEGFHNIKIHTRDYLTNDNILKYDEIKNVICKYKTSIGKE